MKDLFERFESTKKVEEAIRKWNGDNYNYKVKILSVAPYDLTYSLEGKKGVYHLDYTRMGWSMERRFLIEMIKDYEKEVLNHYKNIIEKTEKFADNNINEMLFVSGDCVAYLTHHNYEFINAKSIYDYGYNLEESIDRSDEKEAVKKTLKKLIDEL